MFIALIFWDRIDMWQKIGLFDLALSICAGSDDNYKKISILSWYSSSTALHCMWILWSERRRIINQFLLSMYDFFLFTLFHVCTINIMDYCSPYFVAWLSYLCVCGFFHRDPTSKWIDLINHRRLFSFGGVVDFFILTELILEFLFIQRLRQQFAFQSAEFLMTKRVKASTYHPCVASTYHPCDFHFKSHYTTFRLSDSTWRSFPELIIMDLTYSTDFFLKDGNRRHVFIWLTNDVVKWRAGQS